MKLFKFGKSAEKKEENVAVQVEEIQVTAISTPDLKTEDNGFYLWALEGALKGNKYPLGDQEISFGRDPSCTVVFPADCESISRVHCRLFWKNGVLMLVDQESAFGTFLGSYKLTPMIPLAVKAGELFYVGQPTNVFKVF